MDGMHDDSTMTSSYHLTVGRTMVSVEDFLLNFAATRSSFTGSGSRSCNLYLSGTTSDRSVCNGEIVFFLRSILVFIRKIYYGFRIFQDLG